MWVGMSLRVPGPLPPSWRAYPADAVRVAGRNSDRAPSGSHYHDRDIPPFRTVLIEGWLGTGPYGAKQVGEIATAGVPAALGNAVAHAVGARLACFPITAEGICDALQSKLSSTA